MSKTADPEKIQCPLCGIRFVPLAAACPGCPLAGNCPRVCCPNCRYSFPPESRLVNWLRGHFRRRAGGATEEKQT